MSGGMDNGHDGPFGRSMKELKAVKPTSSPERQTVPDFMVWRCAGCGATAVGKTKPCECATNVGYRFGPNGKTETTWWDEPPSETVAVPRELLERLQEYFEGLVKIAAETEQAAPSEWTRPLLEIRALLTSKETK